MRRAAMVVFLTLLTFDVSGLGALCDEPACDDPCPTDASGGQCPPNCHFCSCCSLPRVTASAVATLIAPALRPQRWIGSFTRLPSPEPADILHVPRPLFA